MGSFYTNVTVRETDKDTLVAFLSGRGRVTYVVPAKRKQYVVFDEFCDPSLALDISDGLNCLTFFVENHDDDILRYVLCRAGKVLDEYVSNPNYFPDSVESATPADACAAVLSEVFAKPRSRNLIEEVLGVSYTFESERHQELAALLGLPELSVNVGYADIESREAFGDEGMRERVHQTPLRKSLQVAQVPVVDESEVARAKTFLAGPERLREFTLRGMVALAARSGRRMQAWAANRAQRKMNAKDAARVEMALLLAEVFCVDRNTELLRSKLAMASFNIEKEVVVVAPSRYDPAQWSAIPPEKRNAFLVARAGYLAGCADFYRGQWNFDIAVNEAIEAAILAIESGIPFYRDFERLRCVNSGNSEKMGSPIDSSDHGPLGALWQPT